MFLEKDGSVSIRKRNFQILATNMYKESKGLSPSIIAEPFKHKGDQHNLRNCETVIYFVHVNFK